MNIMGNQTFRLTCADCKSNSIQIEAVTQQCAIDIARANKWAVARDRKIFYCPNCAVARRNVGKNGGKRKIVQQRIDIPTNG